MSNFNYIALFSGKIKLILQKTKSDTACHDLDDKLSMFVMEEPVLAYTLLSELQHSLQELLNSMKQNKVKREINLIKSEKDDGFVLTQTCVEEIDSVATKPLVTSIIKNWQSKVDSDLVQIKADKIEVDRRIAAFMDRKQKEVDDINIREFCTLFQPQPNQDLESSCARTDAVFVARADSKSHVKVTKVLNEYGPQTRILAMPEESSWKADHTRSIVKQENPSTSTTRGQVNQSNNIGLEERLSNLEGHLKIKPDDKEIFKRLKMLEEKVLHLESLSPEYFSFLSPTAKQRRKESSESKNSKRQHYSVSDIDEKIKLLKQTLLCKKIKQEPT